MHEMVRALREEHQVVGRIIEQLDHTTARARKGREDLFIRLKENIVPHMKAEEKVLYAALMEKNGAREDVLEAREEHHAAAMLLLELEVTAKDSERWHPKFKVFMENIMHHIREEERVIFKDMEVYLPERQMTEMLERYREVRRQEKKELARRVEKRVRATVS
jgi:hemerythrin-like domain-containing protein